MRLKFNLFLIVLILTLGGIRLYERQNTPQKKNAKRAFSQEMIEVQKAKFIDRFNGFQINKPENWKIEPRPKSKDLVKLDLTAPDNSFGLQVRKFAPSSLDINKFTDWYIESFKKEMKNPTLLSRKEFMTPELTGISLCFDGTKRNGYLLKSYIFKDEKHFFALQAGCPMASRQQNEPVLDQIAKSFQIISK